MGEIVQFPQNFDSFPSKKQIFLSYIVNYLASDSAATRNSIETEIRAKYPALADKIIIDLRHHFGLHTRKGLEMSLGTKVINIRDLLES